MERSRIRTYSGRSSSGRYGREREPHHRDVVLSAMLGQITICLILLALAYCLKLSGLPAYETARGEVQRMLESEMNWGSLSAMMNRFDLRMPVWLPGGESNADEASADEDTGRAVSQDTASSNAATDVNTSQAEPFLDDELAGYVEQYLPEEKTASTMAGAGVGTEEYLEKTIPQESSAEESKEDMMPKTRPESEKGTPMPPVEAPGGLEESLGQGGGITPVHFSASIGTKGRLYAPSGTTLAPFYLTQQPVLPVKLGTLTSYFGYRTHPITGEADFHTGVDIAAVAGAPIAAVLPGTVSEVGVSPFYGNFIVLRHSTGLETLYGHCREILAPPGAVIRQYETIARVGSTGMSTGNHVHLEFRVGGQQANPAWVYDEF